MNFKILFFPFVLAFLSACSSLKADFWNEYKIDIQQGNVLSQDAVSQLKPGMTKAQVQQLLGTPSLKDIFHQNRWDYPYQYIEGPTGKTQQVLFSVFFDEQDLLTHIAGNIEASDQTPAPESKIRLVELGKLDEEALKKPLEPRKPPSFFEKIKNGLGFGEK